MPGGLGLDGATELIMAITLGDWRALCEMRNLDARGVLLLGWARMPSVRKPRSEGVLGIDQGGNASVLDALTLGRTLCVTQDVELQEGRGAANVGTRGR